MKKFGMNNINKLNTLLDELKLVHFMPLLELWKVRRRSRYSYGIAQTKMGIIEYVDAATFCAGLKEIFIDEIFKVKEFTSESPVVIDCGANIGLATIYFSKIYNAKVFAYEADPEIFDCFNNNIKNLSLEDRVIAFNKAVWVNEQGVEFDIEGGYSGQIHQDGHDLVKKSVTVPSTRLRDLILEIGHVDLLKIDIEGAENQVIFDCADVLNNVDCIFIEWHSISKKPQMLGEILNLLKNEGFRYHIKDAFTSKFPFVKVKEMCGMDLQLNIFAIRS